MRIGQQVPIVTRKNVVRKRLVRAVVRVNEPGVGGNRREPSIVRTGELVGIVPEPDKDRNPGPGAGNKWLTAQTPHPNTITELQALIDTSHVLWSGSGERGGP